MSNTLGTSNCRPSSACSSVPAQTPWLLHADSCPHHEPRAVFVRKSPPGTSHRCSMNPVAKATAHENRFRQLTTFTPPQPGASAGFRALFVPAHELGSVHLGSCLDRPNCPSAFVRCFPFCKVNCLYGAYLAAQGAHSAHLNVGINSFDLLHL